MAALAAVCAAPSAWAGEVCTTGAPAADCTAARPAIGAAVSGPVMQVMDARSLCVALGPRPDQWVAVTITDAGPGVTRQGLMDAVFAETVDCVVTGHDGETASAVCRRGPASVADLAADAGAAARAARMR